MTTEMDDLKERGTGYLRMASERFTDNIWQLEEEEEGEAMEFSLQDNSHSGHEDRPQRAVVHPLKRMSETAESESTNKTENEEKQRAVGPSESIFKLPHRQTLPVDPAIMFILWIFLLIFQVFIYTQILAVRTQTELNAQTLDRIQDQLQRLEADTQREMNHQFEHARSEMRRQFENTERKINDHFENDQQFVNSDWECWFGSVIFGKIRNIINFLLQLLGFRK